jgi:hypothetical protein
VESSTLQEREELKKHGEKKAQRVFHPKCGNEKRKVSSFPSLQFFFQCVFFSFFLLEKTFFISYLPPPPSYLPPLLVFFYGIVIATKKWCFSEEKDNGNAPLSYFVEVVLQKKKR